MELGVQEAREISRIILKQTNTKKQQQKTNPPAPIKYKAS